MKTLLVLPLLLLLLPLLLLVLLEWDGKKEFFVEGCHQPILQKSEFKKAWKGLGDAHRTMTGCRGVVAPVRPSPAKSQRPQRAKRRTCMLSGFVFLSRPETPTYFNPWSPLPLHNWKRKKLHIERRRAQARVHIGCVPRETPSRMAGRASFEKAE